MRASRFLSAALLLAVFTGWPWAASAEVIQLRTGQVGGVPGTCPGLDDSFRYDPVGMSQCGVPFRNVPFTPADFAAAAAGPPARVITTPAIYLPALGSDPLARWIDWQPNPGCSYGTANSVLYACQFTVHTTCNPVGEVQVCWAVDDFLGDPSGPNPVGIYINGTPLNIGFSGGNYATATCFVQGLVPLNTGVNTLYVYQRDAGCSIAGLILSSRITVSGSTCPTIGVFKFEDANGNGIQDPGEPPLSGWQINLAGPANLSGTTDGSGTVLFPCVPVGSYTVTETTQPGWVCTTPAGGAAHITVDCGQDYAVTFGNRPCQQGTAPCVPLPSCLSAWFPFDECAGTTANEVVANRDGTIFGGISNPTWGPGHLSTPCALKFTGPPGTQQVVAPNCPEHNFGTGSFTIFAWIRTQVNDSSVHCIVDKRVLPFINNTGYSLFLYQGKLRFQWDDGTAGYTTLVSTGPALNDGAWHTVAVSACRGNGAASATLYEDTYADTFTGASIVTGSLTNTAGLTIGDQCPGFLTGIPFGGSIDDLLLFKCCLSAAQIQSLRSDFEYCQENCYLPSMVSTAFGVVGTNLTLCNYSLGPQTYTWTIAGLPAGTGCSVNGPTFFSPASGTVTLPAATSGPSCVTIPISITMPAGMLAGQTACYQVTTQNQATGQCCISKGRIRKLKAWHIDFDPPILSLAPGSTVPISLVVHNDSTTVLPLDFKLSGVSSDGDDQNKVVSLNGLPPGEPVFGTLMVAPGDSGTVQLDVVLSEFQPLNPNEIILEADTDGDGQIEPLACLTLFSSPDADVSGVENTPPAAVVPSVSRITAAPNPFREATGIHLSLAQAQAHVRVEVFNVGGQLVRQIYDGPLAAGTRDFFWDGRDDRGTTSAGGIYFLRARSLEVSLSTKLIRLQ